MKQRRDPKGLEAWHALMGAQAAVVDSLERTLRERRVVPLPWVEALVLLDGAPEGMRMQDLSAHLKLSRSGATRLADRLVEEGLIRRAPCPGDRRGVMASLTEKGSAALRRSLPHLLDAVEEHFSRHLSAPQKREVRSMMDKLQRANGYEPHTFGLP